MLPRIWKGAARQLVELSTIVFAHGHGHKRSEVYTEQPFRHTMLIASPCPPAARSVPRAGRVLARGTVRGMIE